MKTIKLTLLAGALLATSGIAAAQPGEGRRGPAAEITREQVLEQADRQFARLDSDRDGRLTVAEFRQGMQARMQRRMERRQEHRAERLNQGQGERAGRRFEQIDTDRNGQVSPAEMAQHQAQRAQRGQRGPGGANRMEQMFGQDGAMTRDEFRARALQRFERLDANRDGRVTVAERREVRQQMRSERREHSQGQN